MVEKAAKIWLDGKLIDWDDANVHILTHTLHYGLAAFEGIRCYKTEKGSAVFRHAEHVRRLLQSAHIARMEVPYSQAELISAIKETIKANALPECYIRPLIFLGDGPMGLNPMNSPVRTSIITWAWGAYLGEEALAAGVRLRVSSFARHHINSTMTRAKISGYYVNSILAKREALEDGYDEALLLDTAGYVAECSGENIFVVRDGKIKTPSPGSILPGITRASIMQIAADLGYPVQESPITRDDLYIADEIFLCGTAAEVTPVREIDRRQIGSGTRGEITHKIQSKFFEIVGGKDERYSDWLDYL